METGKTKNKSKTKPEVKIEVSIRPGPGSPAQKEAWRRFWQRVISQAKGHSSVRPPKNKDAQLEGG